MNDFELEKRYSRKCGRHSNTDGRNRQFWPRRFKPAARRNRYAFGHNPDRFWDALIREGKVQLQPLPLILGSELAGTVEGIGADISGFKLGAEVYGATNEQFSGAYAE